MVLVLHEAGDTQMKSQASSHVSFLATSRRWNEMFTVAVNQSVSPSASLTFWAGLVFVVETLLSIMGCLAAPLTSTHKRPVASLPPLAVPTKCVSRNHQTCLGDRFAPGWNLCSDWTPPVPMIPGNITAYWRCIKWSLKWSIESSRSHSRCHEQTPIIYHLGGGRHGDTCKPAG